MSRGFLTKPEKTMTKEKTALEWLEALPDGYRELALKYYDPDHDDSYIINSLWSAIVITFVWRDTPEGIEFWQAVVNWAEGKGELPPLPEEEE